LEAYQPRAAIFIMPFVGRLFAGGALVVADRRRGPPTIETSGNLLRDRLART